MTKPNLHNFYINPALQRTRDRKHQHNKGNYTLEKNQESNLSTNPQKDSHTNIIPPLTTTTNQDVTITFPYYLLTSMDSIPQ
jgi:hypothetical protein